MVPATVAMEIFRKERQVTHKTGHHENGQRQEILLDLQMEGRYCELRDVSRFNIGKARKQVHILSFQISPDTLILFG